MSEITFQRGPFDEILPPPLLAHITPEEAWRRYYVFNLSLGVKLDGPQNEAEKPVWYNLAAVYCHQIRLREVIARATRDERLVETELRKQVVEQGQRLSLRPLGLEERASKSFAPVLSRVEGNTWQAGLSEHGRVQVFSAPPAEVVKLAQGVYVGWMGEEKQGK